MSLSPNATVTGGAQTGFTSPTFTIAADTPPESNAKQWYVSALGGTQTGASAHAGASPFTVAFFRPKSFRRPATPNGVLSISGGANGVKGKNTFKLIVRKGVFAYDTNYRDGLLMATLSVDVPVGSESMSKDDIRSAISCLIGFLNGNSAAIGDSIIDGTL